MAIMAVQENTEWGKGLSFEKIWAVLTENRELVKEIGRFLNEKFEEAEREIKEGTQQLKESERKSAEVRAETERIVAEAKHKSAEECAEAERVVAEAERKAAKERVKAERMVAEAERKAEEVLEETKRMVADLSKNAGGLNCSLIGLVETFIAAQMWEKFPQYDFVRPYWRVPILDETNQIITGIDILLSNDSTVMALAFSGELDNKGDVDDQLRRMDLIRKYPPLEVTNKHLLGAVYGGVVSAEIARYAYESGLYVLELAGGNVRLVPPPDGFKPKIW
jgi:hypothetical protein